MRGLTSKQVSKNRRAAGYMPTCGSYSTSSHTHTTLRHISQRMPTTFGAALLKFECHTIPQIVLRSQPLSCPQKLRRKLNKLLTWPRCCRRRMAKPAAFCTRQHEYRVRCISMAQGGACRIRRFHERESPASRNAGGHGSRDARLSRSMMRQMVRNTSSQTWT